IFALANAGVPLGGFGDAIASPVALGIVLGLVVGKPLGILVASYLAVRLSLGRLPAQTSWPMVLGLGAVGGVGFTVSLFIAGLSFPGVETLTEEAKIGILVASALAAAVGVAVLLASTSADEDLVEEELDDAADPAQ